MKKCVILLSVIISLVYNTQAQERDGKSFEIQLGEKLVFDKVVDFALKKDFFISVLNKEANFIQIVKLERIGNSLVSNGKRLTYNFIISKVNDTASVLNLQIKVEDDLYKNYVNFYVDKGITKDISYYTSIMNELNLVRLKKKE
ncbi:hypothetical protein K7A41_05785 [Sphingobacterium sp. InxBP1]|uniref:hypothetical protein n=1 Tax=Sphingobacterium sp. InxBP1 TaxID=2870328 RepID=UPI0022439CE4|nr:hypothetical protein [Sphingobacterium sp. InxBP1]MCW8310724.1 hypothetical protein [Sphingobacterium sp. InxBP1]